VTARTLATQKHGDYGSLPLRFSSLGRPFRDSWLPGMRVRATGSKRGLSQC